MREMVQKIPLRISTTLAPLEDNAEGAVHRKTVYRDREDCLSQDTNWLISQFIPLLFIIHARGRHSKKNIPASLDFIDDRLELAMGKIPVLLFLGLMACFHFLPRGESHLFRLMFIEGCGEGGDLCANIYARFRADWDRLMCLDSGAPTIDSTVQTMRTPEPRRRTCLNDAFCGRTQSLCCHIRDQAFVEDGKCEDRPSDHPSDHCQRLKSEAATTRKVTTNSQMPGVSLELFDGVVGQLSMRGCPMWSQELKYIYHFPFCISKMSGSRNKGGVSVSS